MDRERTQFGTKAIDRSTFLKGAAATGAALAAASSLPLRPAMAASSSVVYWQFFTGGDGVRMTQMQKDFSAANPSIHLTATTLTWGAPFYTKLTTATVVGKGPNIASMHLTRLGAFVASGLVTPLDLPTLATYGITPDKFSAVQWKKAQFNGVQYAVPLDTHPFVLYYNTDICKKAGLLDASGKLKPLVGANAVLNAFKAVQKVTGKYGMAIDSQDVMPWRLFYTLYSQQGGKIISADGKTMVIDDAKAITALTWMAELCSGNVAPNNAAYADAVSMFASGKAGFHWNGDWEATTFQTSKTPYDITLTPNVLGTMATQADSHSLIIPKQKSLSSSQLAANLTCISSLVKDSLVWAEGGHIPAYLPVATSSAYKALNPQSHYAGEAAYATYDPDAWWSGSGSQMETDAGGYFSSVMAGHATPAKALAQFKADIQKFINTPQPTS